DVVGGNALPLVSNVLGERDLAPVGGPRVVLPRLRIIDLRVHHDMHAGRRTSEDASLEMPEPELMKGATPSSVLFGPGQEPMHALAHAVVIDERQDILVLRSVVQVVVLGNGCGVPAGLGVGGDIADQLATNVDPSSITK